MLLCVSEKKVNGDVINECAERWSFIVESRQSEKKLADTVTVTKTIQLYFEYVVSERWFVIW